MCGFVVELSLKGWMGDVILLYALRETSRDWNKVPIPAWKHGFRIFVMVSCLCGFVVELSSKD